MSLRGLTVMITGASRGIGFEIARLLAERGWKLGITARGRGKLEEAADRLGTGNAIAIACDVADLAEAEDAARRVTERFGPITALVNNAGVGGGGRYGEWTDAGWEWTIGVNLMSVIWGIEIFGPLIEAHGDGGQIVSTASIAGFLPVTNPPYNVTKFGVVALSEGLRTELEPRGIGVSVLCPGFIRTKILESARNVPDRFAGARDTTGEDANLDNSEFAEMARQAIAHGIDPLYVGELVREGIEGNWPYIFTDNEFEPAIMERFANVKAGFDRIRGRVPRH